MHNDSVSLMLKKWGKTNLTCDPRKKENLIN